MADAPIRLVHVIDDLGQGGAQRQLAELVKALPRARYRCEVISLSATRLTYAEAIRSSGVPVTLIAQSGKWSWPAFWRVYRALRASRPAVVHTWLFTADLYGRLAAWLAGVPVIISAIRSVEPDKPARYVAVDRFLRHVTSAFTVNAQAIGDVLRTREHVSPQRIHTIYNGVDLRAFDAARTDGAVRRQIAVSAEAPLLGLVGRLVPVKDHATFLQAAALLARRHPRARFLIVGSGPLGPELERFAHTLGLREAVRFLPGQADVVPIFAALDAVVVSSRYEGCANVILEGMAMGKPVIATRIGGNPELIEDGQTGLLVPVADAPRLAQAMQRLLEDPTQARAMGQAGRRRVETHFSLARLVNETTMLYERLLNGRISHGGH